MALDTSISSVSYLESNFFPSPKDDGKTQCNLPLLPLPEGTWNEEKQEIILGPDTLQVCIVQPSLYNSKSRYPESNTDADDLKGNNNAPNKRVTLQDVLVHR